MNPNQLYVPNHEKWIKYYESVGTTEHPYYYIHSSRRSKTHTGGSISKTGRNEIIPIEKHSRRHGDKTSEVKVEFVSPAQQVVEQAASEMQRDNDIKGKGTKRRKQSGRGNRRKKFKFEDVSNQL